MRIVEENTGIFAIRARDLMACGDECTNYCAGVVNCKMFVFRNSNILRGTVDLLNQDCCNLNDFFHKTDSGNVITKSVSFSMEGVNCSFFGIPYNHINCHNDKLIDGLYEKPFVNLNSVDSYNKEEDFDSGKIEEYTKKYVKMNVNPNEIELVVDPSTFRSSFRFMNGNVYYNTGSFYLDELSDLLINE